MRSREKELSWEMDSDIQLLHRPLRTIHLSLNVPPLTRAIRRLFSELQNKGLKFRPHFWIGEEWFCPDGIPGFAIPFYLLHPRLLEFERRFMGVAEGEEPDELIKLLRHETGHAIDRDISESCG